MSLLLSSRDRLHYVSAVEALLSPLEHASPAEWCRCVLLRLEDLCRADRSMFVLPGDGEPLFASDSLDPSILAAFERRVAHVAPGAVRFRDPELDFAMERRRSAGFEVWTNALVERVSGQPMEATEIYHEALRPAGVVDGFGMSVALPHGEAAVCLGRSRPDRGSSDGERTLALLALLLPMFRSGAAMYDRFHARRRALEGLLDALSDAALVVDLDGRELHRNVALVRRLEAEPERDRIVAEMRGAARALAAVRLARTRGSSDGIHGAGEHVVRTTRGDHVIRATFLAPEQFGRDEAILVTLPPAPPALPSPEALRDRYGLTQREAEVARLMAEGLSNRAIGDRLGISPITVRHHGERVFGKLGIRSRKVLALRLLEDARGAGAKGRSP